MSSVDGIVTFTTFFYCNTFRVYVTVRTEVPFCVYCSKLFSLMFCQMGKTLFWMIKFMLTEKFVFGMMDGSNKRGRPHREWSDDIEQWCGATLQELNHACRWWWWHSEWLLGGPIGRNLVGSLGLTLVHIDYYCHYFFSTVNLLAER